MKQPLIGRKIIRKIIVWAVLLTVGIPNILFGESGIKFIGLVSTILVILWDVSASRKEKSHKYVSNKRENSFDEIAQNIALNSNVLAEKLLATYPAKNIEKDRIFKIIIFLILLLVNITKRELSSRMDEAEASKISEDIYLEVINKYMMDGNMRRSQQTVYLEYYDKFEKDFGKLPLEKEGDSLKGSLLWDYSKQLHITVTSKKLEDAFTSMELIRALTYLVQKSEVVFLSKSL
jgi:hypothetical protein